ncbi:unnamed protein product [Urochloa decumbens]|uniref:Zinc finger GRF-type domain-containing protein n=1 Tax=Urochloa decumbens TaxID=240449 RepID=A0ABC8ZGW7_9POAL
MSVGGSPSSTTASGSRGNQLRLVDCPRCGVPVVKIRSKQRETYGQFFFKCPNNIREDSRTCGFIRSEQQYEMYVRGLEKRNAIVEGQCMETKAIVGGQCIGDGNDGNDVVRWQCVELMQETGMLKKQIDMALGEIANLKMQISEMKEEKKAFVMHVSVALAGFVGLLVGMLVIAMWK